MYINLLLTIIKSKQLLGHSTTVDRTRLNPTSHSTLLWSAAPGSLRFTTGALKILITSIQLLKKTFLKRSSQVFLSNQLDFYLVHNIFNSRLLCRLTIQQFHLVHNIFNPRLLCRLTIQYFHLVHNIFNPRLLCRLTIQQFHLVHNIFNPRILCRLTIQQFHLVHNIFNPRLLCRLTKQQFLLYKRQCSIN